MASTITAGNATNGLALSCDNTGILELKTGTGSGTTAITADASQNVTVAGTLTAAKGVGGTPAFSAYQSSATSLPNNTATKLLFGTEVFDTNSNFTSSTFTPTVAGYYQINGKVSISTNSTNSRWIALYKNGSKVTDIGWTVGNGTNYAECGGSYLIYMNGSTDYLDLYAYQNSGSTLSTDGGVSTYFSASLARAA